MEKLRMRKNCAWESPTAFCRLRHPQTIDEEVLGAAEGRIRFEELAAGLAAGSAAGSAACWDRGGGLGRGRFEELEAGSAAGSAAVSALCLAALTAALE